MGLFVKKEAGAACACGGACEKDTVENTRFIVLGACCKKSRQTFENTVRAAEELGFAGQVRNTGDDLEIAGYGVLQTPALVIDGKVVSYGKLLSVAEVKALIEKTGASV